MEFISAVDEKTAFFVTLTLKSEHTLFSQTQSLCLSMHSLMLSFSQFSHDYKDAMLGFIIVL